MPVYRKVSHWLFWGVLTLYGAAAVAILSVRYWVLPNVDNWRPRIEHYASQALGARVTIRHISADWRGLNPRLKLSGLAVYESLPDPVLTLDSVAAVLGWRSMLTLSPTLISLKVDGPELALRRDGGNRLWIAGHAIDLNKPAQTDTSHPALRWLSRQRELVLDHATLHWQDELRGAPPLTFTDVAIVVRNGALSHRFALRASPPAALAAGLELRGELERSLFARGASGRSEWQGQVYAQVDDAEPSAWSAWLPVPPMAGRVAARAWLNVGPERAENLTLDMATRGLAWTRPDGVALQAATAQVHLQGAPGDVLDEVWGMSLALDGDRGGMAIKGELKQASLTLPGVFEQPRLPIDRLQFDGTVSRPPAQGWALNVRHFRVVNDDLDVTLRGLWRSQGKTAAGTADWQGMMARGSMPAIHRYLPLEVNADARAWLSTGLLAGEIRDASIVLKGDLDDFPFGHPGDPGQFRIAGTYANARVDYAPARTARKGWPLLNDLSGDFTINKTGLSLTSAGGTVRTGPDRGVALRAIKAVIPDMDRNAELTVEGDTEGAVEAYLALAANSPLGGLLDGALEQARGSGQWQVPLRLQVPLEKAEDARVQGRIIFSDNSFAFMPAMPLLSELNGVIDFSEEGLSLKAPLRAQFLGGPVQVSGRLTQGRDAIRFEGSLTSAGLGQWGGKKVAQHFAGKAAYQGWLNYAKGGAVDISLESDLVGMALKLPAPLNKPASAKQALKLSWGSAAGEGSRGRRLLSASLGDAVNLLMERDEADAGGPYFARGALGVHRPATLPARGLALSASLPELDLDAWEAVSAAFAPAQPKGSEAAARPALLPKVDRISLSTALLRMDGYTLNDLTLYATRPAAAQWKVDIESRQATGSLFWREASGAIAGQITARFKRLALGGSDDGNKAESALSGNELSDIPAVDLQAQQLLLDGKDVGSLEVLGANLERGRRWRLDTLRIVNDAATLDAKGTWQLEGAARGLTVDASVQLTDAGKLLDRVGLPGTMSGGSGTVNGTMTWRNFPWNHDIADIDGRVQVKLDKGRFMHVNSRTARLLELLSMQSLQRLAKLEFNPMSLLRDGFPFDTIRGNVKLAGGVLTTEDYKLAGPVAAIVLAGDANIVSETWNLKAAVVPNLDASGAAVVTALAVNPLIGLGAFVTQWLLKQPLARAMTAEYTVTGSWDDPKVEPVQRPAVVKPEPQIEH